MNFKNILFYLVSLEIMIGGGGRLTSIGALSLRMTLFLVSMFYIFFHFTTVKKKYVILSFFFLGLLILGLFIGAINNGKKDMMFEDFKSLSYFPMIIFFSININSPKGVGNIISLIKLSSITLSIAYLFLYFSLQSGIIDAKKFYDLTSDSGEFIFRNENVFLYKGFLFSLSGLFFFMFDGEYKDRFARLIQVSLITLILYSVFMTYTRGLIISSLVSSLIIYICYSIVNRQTERIAIYIVGLFFAGVLLSSQIGSTFSDFSDVRSSQDESDLARLLAIEQVVSSITPTSFLIGHGLGIGVESRPIHMEISYLEIFHKQGMLGICFYAFLICKIISKYFKIITNSTKNYIIEMQASSFAGATIFVYIQSATNPLLTNTIGISMILISIVAMDTLNDRLNVFIDEGIVSKRSS